MDRITGLYITVDNGMLKRKLTTKSCELTLDDISISEEIIFFSELKFEYYAVVVELLNDMAADIAEYPFAHNGYMDEQMFFDFKEKTGEIIAALEEENTLQGILTRTLFDDQIPPDDGSAMYVFNSANKIIKCLNSTMELHFNLCKVLDKLCCGEKIDFANEFDYFAVGALNQIVPANGTVQYHFRSMYDYYRFLLMNFIESKPNIARCKCCGKFFVPKTKKMTLYCDRAIWNGRTCKKIAPALKHKLDAEKDKVIKAFDKAKRKMYKRYERSRDSEHELPKGLTYAGIYEWMERAEDVRSRYLNGEISEEEALKVIEA